MHGVTSCERHAGEFIFFLFKIADSMLEPTLRLYIYDLTGGSMPAVADEEAVQTAASMYLMTYKIAVNLPAIVLGLFCGAWSDRVGRKLPVMLCCLGTIIACLLYLGSMMTSSRLAVPLVLLGAFLRGCFGKSAVVTMALHSYIADVTSESERTPSLGRLLAMNYFGYCVGSLLGGALLENQVYKYMGSFCTCILLNTCCVFIAIICMAESVQVQNLNSQECTPISQTVKGRKVTQTHDVKTLEQPFQWRNMLASLNVLQVKRAGSLRCRLITLFCLIILVQLCKSGEVDVMLLYVERAPLEWAEATYSYLLAADYAAMGLVQLAVLPLLTKCCHCSDNTLIFVGLLFKSSRLLLLTFSTTTWQVFAAVLLGSPLSLIISGIKSRISKTVGEREVGKTFSTLSCGELVANLLGALLFNNVYAATSYSIFPGFTFVLDLVLHFCMMFAVCAVTSEDRKNCCANRCKREEAQEYDVLQYE